MSKSVSPRPHNATCRTDLQGVFKAPAAFSWSSTVRWPQSVRYTERRWRGIRRRRRRKKMGVKRTHVAQPQLWKPEAVWNKSELAQSSDRFFTCSPPAGATVFNLSSVCRSQKNIRFASVFSSSGKKKKSKKSWPAKQLTSAQSASADELWKCSTSKLRANCIWDDGDILFWLSRSRQEPTCCTIWQFQDGLLVCCGRFLEGVAG